MMDARFHVPRRASRYGMAALVGRGMGIVLSMGQAFVADPRAPRLGPDPIPVAPSLGMILGGGTRCSGANSIRGWCSSWTGLRP